MGFENLKPVTLPVGGAIAQGVFVTIDASGNAVVSGNNADAVGVSLESVSASQFAAGKTTIPVALISAGGKCRVKVAASTAIAVGGRVASAANGEAKAAATGSAELGTALQASGSDADQEVITVLLDKSSKLTP